MNIYSTYKVKIKHYNSIFKKTVDIYRSATDYLIDVCIKNWESVSCIEGSLKRQRYVETLVNATCNNPSPKYDFDDKFYKLPSYLRRGAINEAIGKVSSYTSNLSSWELNPKGKKPSMPKAGFIYPTMYRTVMYNPEGEYKAQIKVYVRNTWDWI